MDCVDLPVVMLLDEHLLLERPERTLRTEGCLSARETSVGSINVVVIAYLIDVAALESGALTNDDFFLLNEVEVGIEFAHRDVAVAARDIDLVAVEKHARVVVVARESLHIPFALGICCREQPGPVVVAIDEKPEPSVVVLHRRSPHAFCVSVLTIAEVVAVIVKQSLQRQGTVLPIDEILALDNGGSGEELHCCADHVVGRTDANDVGVGEVGANDGIDVMSACVARVRRLPVLGLCLHHHIQQGKQQNSCSFHIAVLFFGHKVTN